MTDLRIIDAPLLTQAQINDSVKLPTGGDGNYSIQLSDLAWYVIADNTLADVPYVNSAVGNVNSALQTHIADYNNPHQVTKAQVGLDRVDNTADLDKPVSNAVNSAIITAVDGLATHAYVDSSVAHKVDKTYVDSQDDLKANKATTLSGYGITDTYTKTETDTKIANKTVNSLSVDSNDVLSLKLVDNTTKSVDLTSVFDNGIARGIEDVNVKVKQPFTGALSRTQHDKNLEFISVKDFGAKGDYITDDTAAINDCFSSVGIGDVVYFPRGVYSYTGSLSIPEGVKIVGDFAPNLQFAPLMDDDKRFLRPGYKHLLPGSSIIFKGVATATKTMTRSDQFASFNYALKTHLNTPNDISNIGIIMDMDVFDADGKLTKIAADNRSDYDVGLLIDDSHHCYINNVCVFGYWKKTGLLVASYGRAEGVSDNPDYIKCIRSVFSGDYGVALLGHDVHDPNGIGEGLSGTTFIGCDIHDRTHHSRSELTANPSERGRGVIFIDGITKLNTMIAGHMFIGCGLRGTTTRPIQLKGCDAFSLIGCTTEFTGSGQVYVSVTENTRRVVLHGVRHISQSINIRNLASALKNGVLVCDEDAAGCAFITKNAKGIKYGASDQISNDPALQLSTDFSSFLNGFNIRYSVANSSLQFNYNGANAVTIDSSGDITPVGRVKKTIGSGARENRTISAGVITITGASSFIAVAGEGSAADVLTTISGGVTGDIIVLVAFSALQPITVKHNTSLIRLSGSADFVINNAYSNITLMFNGTQWIEISRTTLD